jgi:hypothetical protein
MVRTTFAFISDEGTNDGPESAIALGREAGRVRPSGGAHPSQRGVM